MRHVFCGSACACDWADLAGDSLTLLGAFALFHRTCHFTSYGARQVLLHVKSNRFALFGDVLGCTSYFAAADYRSLTCSPSANLMAQTFFLPVVLHLLVSLAWSNAHPSRAKLGFWSCASAAGASQTLNLYQPWRSDNSVREVSTPNRIFEPIYSKYGRGIPITVER